MDYVTTCVVVWIEILLPLNPVSFVSSPPAWWCGLKYHPFKKWLKDVSHHLRGGVDWNNIKLDAESELDMSPPAWWCGLKYTHLHIGQPNCIVTTCVVVWIEICAVLVTMASFGSHHLRGGVDWNTDGEHTYSGWMESPPAWWCGLKFWTAMRRIWLKCHHLRGGVDWNYPKFIPPLNPKLSPPAWWCGLKLVSLLSASASSQSPPAWWCGLK